MTPDALNLHLVKTLRHGRVAVTVPAGCPNISLYLFDPEMLKGPLSHEEAQAVVAEPAYWSFCWASGQVLAAHILAHPHLVEGKKVLDFGSGSGVVAIAAAMAGAREVIACDIDQAALDAVAANARLNGVSVALCDDWEAKPNDVDVVTAADVLYDPENRPLLAEFRLAANSVVLADSRLRNLGDHHYELQDVVEARTWPDLNEFEEFNRVRVYLTGQSLMEK